MANAFLTPTNVANAALGNLYAETGVAQNVHRDFEPEFQSGKGKTVNVRKPAVLTSSKFDRATGINVQDISEGTIPVVMDTIRDVSVAVTSEQWTLDINDFTAQVIAPAMEAIAQDIDRDLIAQFYADVSAEVEGNEDPRTLLDARAVLGRAKVPTSMRRAIVGPAVASNWLRDPLFHEADKRGDTAGLRTGLLGSGVFGYDVFETANIDVDGLGVGTGETGIAFHETALALVTRPLAIPEGVVKGAVANYKGLSIRVVYGYDQKEKQSIISFDCLYGIKTLDPTRAVLLKQTAV